MFLIYERKILFVLYEDPDRKEERSHEDLKRDRMKREIKEAEGYKDAVVLYEWEDSLYTIPRKKRVVKAWYGHPTDPEKRIDATEKLSAGQKVTAKNHFWGNDPAWGVAKYVYIAMEEIDTAAMEMESGERS